MAALSCPEAMAYLGIKHRLTFQRWCEATGMYGSPKNPTKKLSPRTWTIEELDRGRQIAQEIQHPPLPTKNRSEAPTPSPTETPEELLNRLFPRKRAKKKP